jgi:hypothetical protein
VPPGPALFSECLPLLDRVVVAHGEITAGTDGSQIRGIQGPSCALGLVVTHVEVKDADDILAPPNMTRVFVGLSEISEPHLFSDSLRDIGFRGFRVLWLNCGDRLDLVN